jgi:putative transposase
VSDPACTISFVSHGAVRVRLDVTDVEASVLLRAAGARRYAFNWAVAKIKANADQWSAEATYDIDRADRVRPLSFFTLAKMWTAEKPTAAPWAGEHSTWTFRYALRDAATAHQAFLAGRHRFPRFKARHRDRARFTVRDGLALGSAGCASRSTGGCASPRPARSRRSCAGWRAAGTRPCSTSP